MFLVILLKMMKKIMNKNQVDLVDLVVFSREKDLIKVMNLLP